MRPTAHPVLGFYGPGTQMWRINREAVLLGAGACALLLQLAHPQVAEGVAQHSNFEADPWRRLRGTLRTSLALVFGDKHEAEAAIAKLNGIHARVRGDVEDELARSLTAARYHALDPALLLWVQVTLIVTSVQAYERWVAPLTPGEREGFWAEAREYGQLLGIPLDQSPADWTALMAYWTRMLGPTGPIHVTPTARRMGASVLRPPIPFAPGAIVELLMLPSMGLLPARLREEYGIDWNARRRLEARAMDVLLKVWVRLLPSQWRALPPARTADRRAQSMRG
jgi:uncharacterized protein (DUF2236 family)